MWMIFRHIYLTSLDSHPPIHFLFASSLPVISLIKCTLQELPPSDLEGGKGIYLFKFFTSGISTSMCKQD